ncbi:MAG: CPBP family intramembrane metalloprotease, partial [Treponema sp.]|nr:CPBP family intramembrane metalloprotease [Treponema sp.]
MMENYKYRPVKFYLTAFAVTWFFWFEAILFNEGLSCTFGMLLGLLSPATIAIFMVFRSNNSNLINDFKRKILGFYILKPANIILAVVVFIGIIIASILLSTFWGQSLNQLAFTEDFSFTGAGIGSAFLTILLASVIEEVGWRGYGEDSIAQYCSWFKESIIFGFVWSFWHFPLFWIPGTYHFELRNIGLVFMLNFFISVIPLGFITTWVYVKNGRSMLASIIFHLFVNFMQERIALTPITKCVETAVVLIVAVVIVVLNKDMFF